MADAVGSDFQESPMYVVNDRALAPVQVHMVIGGLAET